MRPILRDIRDNSEVDGGSAFFGDGGTVLLLPIKDD